MTSTICEAIIFDQRHIFPLSHWNENWQCCISLPVVLGRAGVVSTVALPLNDVEGRVFTESAERLKAVIDRATELDAKSLS